MAEAVGQQQGSKGPAEQKPPEQKTPPPPPPPPSQAPAAPAPLQVKLISNGDPARTRLVDAATGQEVKFACHGRADLSWHPRGGGHARIVLVFADVLVEVDQDHDGRPFEIHGAVVGEYYGPLPEGVTMTPLPGGQSGQSTGSGGIDPRLHPTTAAAMRANEQANQNQPGRR